MCLLRWSPMRPSGTAEQLEKRRRQAIELLQAGTPYREVARRVGAVTSQPPLELAKAGTARPPARRGCDREVEAGRMAQVKKTPRAEALISHSSMRAAFCSSPTSARPGRPSGGLRVFGIATDGTEFPLSPHSRWRRVAVDSGCTSIVTFTTSRAPRSSRFSASCSVISEARLSCYGTAGKSLGVGTSRLFSAAIPGCRPTACPAMRRSSIPMSSSGRRPSASCPTSITMGSSRLGCTSCDPFSASAGRKPCFARASPRPIFRGCNPSGQVFLPRQTVAGSGLWP